MNSTARLAPLAALLALLLTGCTVLDNRTLGISQEASQRPGLEVAFFVWASHVDQVRLEIDAAPVGTFPTNTLITVDCSGLVPGAHLLTARAVSGRPLEEATLTFQVAVPPAVWLTRVDPPFGSAVRTDQPLAVTLEFSEPVLLDGVDLPLGLRMTGPSPGVAILSQAPDGLSVRFDLADLSGVATIGLQGQVRTARGGRLGFYLASQGWVASAPEVLASFLDLAQDLPVSGLVTLRPLATWNFGPPASAEILANDRVIFTLGPPPWDPVDWDTAGLPDGRYVVWLRVPGYTVRQQYPWPSYLVSRTSPVGTCSTSSGLVGEIGFRECIQVRFEVPVDPHGGFELMWARYYPLATTSDFSLGSTVGRVCALEPFAVGYGVQLQVGSVTTLDGRPLTLAGCSFSVPPSIAPFGAGPLTAGGAELRATELSVTGWWDGLTNGSTSWAATLAWVGAAGAPGEGHLLLTGGQAPGLLATPIDVGAMGLTPSHPSIFESRLVFSARAGSGPGDILASAWNPVGGWPPTTGSPLDATVADDAAEPIVRSGLAVTAWTEGSPGGARALRGATTSYPNYDVFLALPARAPASPGGVISSPALEVYDSSLATVAMVAFLEASPGGGPRLRSASLELGQGAWVDAPSDLDLGLGPPSDPAILVIEPPASLVGVPVLAWVEDGQVRLRMGTIDATGLSFGPPLSLNHDPTRPARLARLVSAIGGGATLLFVEAGPNGDELWARRWDGSAWLLQPGPLDASTGDTVQELAVGSSRGVQPLVAWTDALGRVYLRVLNW